MVDDPEMSIEKATAKAQTALSLFAGLSKLYQYSVLESTCPICLGELRCRSGCILARDYPSNFIRIEAVRRIINFSSHDNEILMDGTNNVTRTQ